MIDVILIRPGETDFDEQNRIQGSLDLPLNSCGQEQVKDVVDQLRGVPIAVVYAAPSEPVRSTAEAIGAALDIPVKEIDGLRNLNQGLWQGLQIEDVRRKYPKVFKQWQEGVESICPPEGETISEAVERILKALQKPMKKKGAFAIVVSEPLATLVGCVVEGRSPRLPDLLCGSGRSVLVEKLEASAALSDGRALKTGFVQSDTASVTKVNSEKVGSQGETPR